MLSINLIDELLDTSRDASIVTYFLCQNDDRDLNTLEAIVKGLMRCLIEQRGELKEHLRCRWDQTKGRFEPDLSSWLELWSVFTEMLESCRCQRIYVIVDALDECQSQDMDDFLRTLVRSQTTRRHSKIKWLLTSRPLESAERQLLPGNGQTHVDLELNSAHVAQAVTVYISRKMKELEHRHRYGETLLETLEAELKERAEDTFLWVSLVCKTLENVHRNEALSTLRHIPPGLDAVYRRILDEIEQGDSMVSKTCLSLLQVIMLAYRPLDIAEAASMMDSTDKVMDLDVIITRCATIIRRRENTIELIHQSARDYLAGDEGRARLIQFKAYEHGEIAFRCMSMLSKQLRFNIANLTHWDADIQSTTPLVTCARFAGLNYAATSWVNHLKNANPTAVRNALEDHKEVSSFLSERLLEWLEYLSLQSELSRAVTMLAELVGLAQVSLFAS